MATNHETRTPNTLNVQLGIECIEAYCTYLHDQVCKKHQLKISNIEEYRKNHCKTACKTPTNVLESITNLRTEFNNVPKFLKKCFEHYPGTKAAVTDICNCIMTLKLDGVYDEKAYKASIQCIAATSSASTLPLTQRMPALKSRTISNGTSYAKIASPLTTTSQPPITTPRSATPLHHTTATQPNEDLEDSDEISESFLEMICQAKQRQALKNNNPNSIIENATTIASPPTKTSKAIAQTNTKQITTSSVANPPTRSSILITTVTSSKTTAHSAQTTATMSPTAITATSPTTTVTPSLTTTELSNQSITTVSPKTTAPTNTTNTTHTKEDYDKLLNFYKKQYSAGNRYHNHKHILETHLQNDTNPSCLDADMWRIPRNMFNDAELQAKLVKEVTNTYMRTTLEHINRVQDKILNDVATTQQKLQDHPNAVDILEQLDIIQKDTAVHLEATIKKSWTKVERITRNGPKYEKLQAKRLRPKKTHLQGLTRTSRPDNQYPTEVAQPKHTSAQRLIPKLLSLHTRPSATLKARLTEDKQKQRQSERRQQDTLTMTNNKKSNASQTADQATSAPLQTTKPLMPTSETRTTSLNTQAQNFCPHNAYQNQTFPPSFSMQYTPPPHICIPPQQPQYHPAYYNLPYQPSRIQSYSVPTQYYPPIMPPQPQYYPHQQHTNIPAFYPTPY